MMGASPLSTLRAVVTSVALIAMVAGSLKIAPLAGFVIVTVGGTFAAAWTFTEPLNP